MKPRPDGRIYACEYCGAQLQAAIDAEQISNGLRLDISNAEAFLVELSKALHGHIGDRTKLHTEGTRIIAFELHLDPDIFMVKRETHGIVAHHKKVVRGIALANKTHPLDAWVILLSKALANHANENARVAQVLATLRGA
jgi:hypothetical protein